VILAASQMARTDHTAGTLIDSSSKTTSCLETP
jgi:hypothetical protein